MKLIDIAPGLSASDIAVTTDGQPLAVLIVSKVQEGPGHALYGHLIQGIVATPWVGVNVGGSRSRSGSRRPAAREKLCTSGRSRTIGRSNLRAPQLAMADALAAGRVTPQASGCRSQNAGGENGPP